MQSSPRVEEELLKLLANQSWLSPLPVIMSMSVVALMASDKVPTSLWLGWICAVAVLQVVRATLFVLLPRLENIDVTIRIDYAVGMNLANTVVHSLSFVVFPDFSPFERAVQSMLFVGMGAASAMTTAGFRWYVLPHIVVGLLPMYGLWAWSAMQPSAGVIEVAIPLIGVFYSLTLISVSAKLYALFEEVFYSRQSMQQALTAAERAVMAKTRFLASASHDLRQPLHSLSLFVASLSMQKLDDRSQEIVTHIESSIDSLRTELDGLLDISKLDAGVVEKDLRNFSLYDFLDRLVNQFRPQAREAQVQLFLSCDYDAVVRSDPALLERVLMNLLSNAVKHGEGDVDILVSKEQRKWVISVSDNGPGVDADQREHIFEEFYQVDNPERDRSKGLGLGLAIVKRISDLLALDVTLDADAGRGAVFKIRVPAVMSIPSFVPAEEVVDYDLQGLRILVVDDESAVRLGMKCVLENFGSEVLLAEGTEAAVKAVRKVSPNIALVDLRLRGEDHGIRVVEALRKVQPDLPCILISGETDLKKLVAAREAGLQILHKPLLPGALVEAIHQNATSTSDGL